MNVVIEKPVTWLESERDGGRNRLMYENLLKALKMSKVKVTETDTYYGSDFIERTAPAGGTLISYHSIGSSTNVWRLKETSIPFFYNLDKSGYSGWSELCTKKEEYEEIISSYDERDAKNYCSSIAKWLVRENISKYKQGAPGKPCENEFVLFPMQIRSDNVAQHNRLDPLDVLHEASKICREEKKILLVKRHPYCTSRKVASYLAFENLFNKYVKRTQSSITSLLPLCSSVLVGNSGVGLEAIIYGKPVFSFAGSEYEMAAYQIANLKDIRMAFSRTIKEHPNGYRFGHYFLSERCFDARNIDDIREKLRNLVGIN
jgi:hypothetical protein